MITVRHHAGSYNVVPYPKESLLEDLPAGAFIVTDQHVAAQFPTHLPTLVLPPGEESKSFDAYRKVVEWLAENGAKRSSTVVALGGGVVGDLAGFAAATYMRGVKLLQIPTSLLAQVDSSVGGKVGIDLPAGKNLVGAFMPPSEVRLCVEALHSLPTRHFINGMAEVWKYGFIQDESLLETLRSNPLHAGHPLLAEVVTRCIRLKAEVVEEDEFETKGRRAILNFGHTIGHAIEQVLRYQDLLHGEAISIGMVLEARLGERLGITPAGTSEVVAESLRTAGLPITHPVLARSQELIAAMRRDKKAGDAGLAFSLLTKIGGCKLVHTTALQEVEAVLKP